MKDRHDPLERKREDSAYSLPVLGLFLLVSPILNAFVGLETVLGAPVAYLYIFAAWGFLILLTAALARRLVAAEDEENDAR